MKANRKITVLLITIFSLVISNAFSQRNAAAKERQHDKKVVVANRKHHLFRKAVVYHPRWAPRAIYIHRWVYFPRYNFYWDNFHSVYVIRTGTVWITSSTTPTEVENVDLSKEKNVELGEESDGQDAIQEKNDDHQKVYKVQ